MLGLGQMLMGAGGGASGPLRPQDVFATTLYTGNAASQTITTGIDLVGAGDGTRLQGGLVWQKARSGVSSHYLSDSVRGASSFLFTDTTGAQTVSSGFSYSSTGYTGLGFASGVTVASWTFRRAVKFFDVVAFTGDGNANTTIPHSLGVAPGLVVVKRVGTVGSWATWHRGNGGTSSIYSMQMNLTQAGLTGTNFDPYFTASSINPTYLIDSTGVGSTTFGVSYIAYIFAHDPDTVNGIIQCGSYTGNGSSAGPTITLGWEPQYILIKAASVTSNWVIFDAVRGIQAGAIDRALFANATDAETTPDVIRTLSTGFKLDSASGFYNGAGQTYTYLAIRKAT